MATALSAKCETALQQLLEAHRYACDAGRDPWQFAVEMEALTAAGLTTSDLRWLVSKGYIEHASELTRPSDDVRKFQRHGNLSFGARTCFVLTSAGHAVAATRHAARKNGQTGTVPIPERAAQAVSFPGDRTGAGRKPAGGETDTLVAVSPPPPHWDEEYRILYLGEQVVKQYRFRSPNQEAVLAAFEEEGWPRQIDDPLPPLPELCSKDRLRETIKSLNSAQENRLIRFRGDGTGERVRWELVDSAESQAREEPRWRRAA